MSTSDGTPDPTIVTRLRAAGCVFAEDEARLLTAAAGGPEELDQLVERRVAGQPLEYLLGWVEFGGLRVAVAPGVFVPRRRTELLARAAITLARRRPRPVVVELCCGAAAVTAVLLAAVPDADVSCVDIDPAAVACARHNAPTARLYVGDLYAPLPGGERGQVDIVVANAPYVPTAAIALMPPEARDHEPAVALDGGPDGLDILRRIVAGALDWLAPGGHLLVESSAGQAPVLVAEMLHDGLSAQVETDGDLAATVIVASRAGRVSP